MNTVLPTINSLLPCFFFFLLFFLPRERSGARGETGYVFFFPPPSDLSRLISLFFSLDVSLPSSFILFHLFSTHFFLPHPGFFSGLRACAGSVRSSYLRTGGVEEIERERERERKEEKKETRIFGGHGRFNP